MDWLHPGYLWLLLAAPALAALYLWAAAARRRAARTFGDAPLVRQLTAGVSARRRRYRATLVVLGAFALALALAGPRFGTQVREVTREGVDLVVALDVSASMQAEDVAPNRLERARNEIKKLLGDLRGDRVGLVIFAGDAFIQAPLTTDYGAIRLFLDVADPSLIPTPGTDFGAALRQASRAFEVDEAAADPRTRVLLIVSDGENHVADVDALVQEARAENIVVFAAGVGETDGAPIPLYQGAQRVGYKSDRTGQRVLTRLEEDGLRALARDGSYFRVGRTASTLPELTTALERLDRTEFGAEEFETYEERYQWPLALALLLLAAERMIPARPVPERRVLEPS